MTVTPGFPLAREHAALNGRRAAIGGEKAGVNVPHAEGKAVERFEAQNLTVSAGDHDVAAERFKRGDFLAELCGLKYGDSAFGRKDLHGAGREDSLPALRLIRLNDDSDDLPAAFEYPFEGLHRKRRRARKYDFHEVFPSSVRGFDVLRFVDI